MWCILPPSVEPYALAGNTQMVYSIVEYEKVIVIDSYSVLILFPFNNCIHVKKLS